MMPWSQEQQHLLRAMGYVLYERAPMPASIPADAPRATTAEKTGEFARLLRALQSAASGLDVSWVGDLAALRGNPRAKRALWPKLRALRRAASASGVAGRMPEAPDAT